MSSDDSIHVGEIVGVFGIKGWVKVYSLTDPRENILGYSPWLLKKGHQQKLLDVVDGKRQGKSVVASLEGIVDRNQSEELIGWEIFISRKQLPSTEEGEYYWVDLVGLKVITEQGVDLGIVDHLMETGANDVLVVHLGDVERLIPLLHEQVVKKVDFDNQEMIVDWDPDF